MMLKKVQRITIRVEKSEEFLKPIKMVKSASLWLLSFWENTEQHDITKKNHLRIHEENHSQNKGI